jgi:hypothetical protein
MNKQMKIQSSRARVCELVCKQKASSRMPAMQAREQRNTQASTFYVSSSTASHARSKSKSGKQKQTKRQQSWKKFARLARTVGDLVRLEPEVDLVLSGRWGVATMQRVAPEVNAVLATNL